jgi:hypothetical protein
MKRLFDLVLFRINYLVFMIALLFSVQTAFAQGNGAKELCGTETASCNIVNDLYVGDDALVGGDVVMFNSGGRGSGWTKKWVTGGPTTLSGATTNCGGASFIPAGSTVEGCIVRVTTLITGATSFKVGDGSDDDKWGAGILLTVGTNTTGANFTAGSPTGYAAATTLVITAVGGAASFSAGALRCPCLVSTFTPFSK